jgi:hypothetical protein
VDLWALHDRAAARGDDQAKVQVQRLAAIKPVRRPHRVGGYEGIEVGELLALMRLAAQRSAGEPPRPKLHAVLYENSIGHNLVSN